MKEFPPKAPLNSTTVLYQRQIVTQMSFQRGKEGVHLKFNPSCFASIITGFLDPRKDSDLSSGQSFRELKAIY